MRKNLYPIFGDSPPPMLGRVSLFNTLQSRLPNHVTVMGPRWYGKSVLLHHLANTHRASSQHYLTTAFIDLRHRTPESDADFLERFGMEIKKALNLVNKDLAGYLDLKDISILRKLEFVLGRVISSWSP